MAKDINSSESAIRSLRLSTTALALETLIQSGCEHFTTSYCGYDYEVTIYGNTNQEVETYIETIRGYIAENDEVAYYHHKERGLDYSWATWRVILP